MMRLEVAVAAPLPRSLTYLFNDEAEGESGAIPVGKRVLVPLGSRKLTGFVLGSLPDEIVPYALREIIEVLDPQPLFPANLIPVFRWIAGYYHYPIGEVIKTALPGGLAPRSGKQICLSGAGREHLSLLLGLSESLPVEEDLSAKPINKRPPDWLPTLVAKGLLTAVESRKILNRLSSRRLIQSWQEQGWVEIQEILVGNATRQKNEICYARTAELSLPSGSTVTPSKADIESFGACFAQQRALPLTFPQLKTLYFLHFFCQKSSQKTVPAKELNKAYSGAAKVLPSLQALGVVVRLEQRVFRNPYGAQLPWFPPPEELTPEQQQALSQLLPAVQQKKFTPFLLHGVTGCGKTEVYLRAAAACLAMGRDVLILVPEIALATQLEAHFVSRFGGRVLLLHSGLSAGERFDQWAQAFRSQKPDGSEQGGKGTRQDFSEEDGPRIVIGARSAVFAPLPDIGLIVVDEEHDGGYKQDDGLRYNGRDVAVLRASLQDAVVVLGSATPSVTSFYHARTGKYQLLTMSKRVQDRSLPAISLVSLRDKSEKAYGMALGHKLQRALQETLAAGKQSLLLLNRRGFAAVSLCQDCGKPVECRHCHISLTLHKGRQQLVCHYCGFTLPSNQLCSGCHSEKIVPVGFGTERIEQEVGELLPEARIARLDTDTATDRKKFLHLLQAMHHREIDILIGTQMIAKGHDFPFVTLVGVVWADGGLTMPDFRAAERTYQLLSQVSGRAGRGESPGQVIIQTLRPDHYAVALAQRNAYEELYEREIGNRQIPAFPPLLRLINIHIQGSREQQVKQTATAVAALCHDCGKSLMAGGGEGRVGGKVKGKCLIRQPIEVLGPAPSPLDRLRDLYRWQVLLKGWYQDDLHLVCDQVLTRQSELTQGDVQITVDVDPENMS